MNDSMAVFIQARLSSTRLPGKANLRIGQETAVNRVTLAAVQAMRTSYVRVLWAEDYPQYPQQDVLSRFLAGWANLKSQGCMHRGIVRLTGDCPLMDPQVIDLVVERFLAENADYCSNVFPRRTFPDGLDVEVFKPHVLESAAQLAESAYDREHVTPWMQANCSRISSVELPVDWSRIRLTLDTEEDYRWLCAAINAPLNP